MKELEVSKKVNNQTYELEDIKNIIKKKIEGDKSDLNELKRYIEDISNRNLNALDHVYIERKYLKHSLKLWLQEVTNFLNGVIKNFLHHDQNVISEIFSIQNINQIPNYLKKLQYYELVFNNNNLIKEDRERIIISNLKEVCFKQLTECNSTVRNEINFVKNLLEFLRSSENLDEISNKLNLPQFCSDGISFVTLLKIIINLGANAYGKELKNLQDIATALIKQEQYFLLSKIKELVKEYITPVKIHKKKVDTKWIIEIIGRSIIIKDILTQLESQLKEANDIDEVRFIGSESVHIHVSLQNSLWHGKNIVIYTKVIKIHNVVTWDVSGKNIDLLHHNDVGTDENGDGKNGADGFAGESGGNVSILAEVIENPENWTIVSNGGNGGNGQNGGNGKDGKDGKSITEAEFNRKFPSTIRFACLRSKRKDILDDVIRTIKNISSIKKHVEFGRSNVYIEAETGEGNEIIFSYCCATFNTNYQSYLLYRGSLGKPGGQGGECGLGGQGGYQGEINVSNPNVKVIAKRGEDGKNGKGGLYGNYGKNGWDIANIDYQYWSEGVYYGTDQESKLNIEYYNTDNQAGTRIWCPYHEKYVEIEVKPNQYKKQRNYEERKRTSQNRALQKQALSTRKTPIIPTSFTSDYSQYCNRTNDILQNLTSNFEQTESNIIAVIYGNEKEKRTQEINVEINAKRCASTLHLNKNKKSIQPFSNCTKIFKKDDTESNDNLIRTLGNSTSLKDWFIIKDKEMTYSDLKQLFIMFASTKKKVKSKKYQKTKIPIQSIEKNLIEKYKFAILQEIAVKLPILKNLDVSKELFRNVEKYLIVTEKADTKISHHILGTLNQYIFNDCKEQRKKICRYCEESLSEKDSKALKCSMKAFILESKDTKDINPNIKKYCNGYLEYLQNKTYNINIYLEAISKEARRDTMLYNLWIECNINKSKECLFNETIKKDKFLYMLYSRFKSYIKQEYEWNGYFETKDFLNEYNKYMAETGLVSSSYRELLACLYNINIKIYKRDTRNQFLLLYDHNALSEKSIHILKENNEYIKLEINEDHLQLDEKYKRKGALYGKILKSIESFAQKDQFDEYLKSQTYLSFSTIQNKKLEQPIGNEDNTNEEQYIEQIISFFPETEQFKMRQYLEKIMHQYIGQQGILYCIAQRFINENRHVSAQVLYYLINSIINYVIENEKESTTIFHWIITSYSQKHWMSELIFLQLEAYYKKSLTEELKLKEYLLKINEDILILLKMKLDQEKFVSIQCINDTLYLLSNIPYNVEILKDLGLSEWPYFLKGQYWMFKLSELINWKEDEELSVASYYVLSLENTYGDAVTEQLLKILKTKNQNFTSKDLIFILYNFYNQNWELNQNILASASNHDITSWINTIKDQVELTNSYKERNIVQLISMIKDNGNTSSKISNMLPKIKEYIFNASIEKNISNKAICEFTKNDIKKWTTTLKNFEKESSLESKKSYVKERYAEVLAVIDRAIELEKGFKLRDTQKLSILTLLANESNTLEQISTGEGKSLIVVAVSIVKALCGEQIDIITSSPVLAKRDAEENQNIYKLFDISVSYNCIEVIEKRKQSYSNEIVYGDLSSFQRDYLLDRFYNKNILGNRKFENIIIDEVDSMLLDKGNNMLYLSHDLAGFNTLESVYVFIWQWINKPSGSFEDFCQDFDPKVIKAAVLYNLYGLIEEADIKRLDTNLNKEEVAMLWSYLVDANILDNKGKLLKENVNIDQIKNILPTRFSSYANRLYYLIDECINREKYINVPNYLKVFIEEHLDAWITSAKMAFIMQERRDYIIDIDRTTSSSDRNPQIIILDRDTGTDQSNSQWDEALHQFLQLKHGCKLSLQSLKSVYISNVSYIKLYSNLYGLSGTLGSIREKNLLKDIYKVDFIAVPTARPKQFYEMKPIICNSEEEWISEICETTMKFTEKELRSVLIICETVNDVEKLYKVFNKKIEKNIHTYIRDYEEFSIAKGDKQVEQKQIIIATNLAGRGTDIKITKLLNEAGGLHVCLTYLPNNARIEQQAFGRAARSGYKGSGQLILISPKNKQINLLKKERDFEELCRTSRIKDHYENRIIVEEIYFNKFKKQYETLKKDLDKNEVSIKLQNILLLSCLDKWTFWLDKNVKHLKDATETNKKENFNESIDKFIAELQSKCKTDWSQWVQDNPYHMLKLGLYFAETAMYDKAIGLFNKVIEREPDFSEAARYYKAFAIGKKIDFTKKDVYKTEIKEFKMELHEVSERLNSRQNISKCTAGITSKSKSNTNEGFIKIEAYVEQSNNIQKILNMFVISIDDIFGHNVLPQHFISFNIKETLAEIIYKDMIEIGILNKPKVITSIPKVTIEKIGKDFNIPIEKLSNVLNKLTGEEITEQSFIKILKKHIVLPSREAFWKLLIANDILSKEFIYVIFNKEKLEEIDPSLLDQLLEEKTNKSEESLIDKKSKQIFLYAEKVRVNNNTNDIVFEKNYIKNMIGEEKYHTLKIKGIFSCNKIAYLNLEKISFTFPYYDSITVSDFKQINVSAEEAEKILSELVSKKILANDNIKNNTYRLMVTYMEIQKLKLSFCPIYEINVKILLSVCFAYRIAFQKMLEDFQALTEQSDLLRLQLLSKTHNDLFFSLIDEGIIKLATVTTECISIEDKVKAKYCMTKSKTDIMHILQENRLIPLKLVDTALWDDLIEKEWIFVHSLIKDGSLSLTNMYSINPSHETRKSLNSIYKNIEKTLHIIMNNHSQLSNDITMENIISTLRQLRSSLETLENPEPYLQSLVEANGKELGNIEEIRVFLLNGFDQLLKLEEKKWTLKMLFNTALVVTIGICQITIGVLIELCSVGVMTHVGNAFISEGISDLIFATSCLVSGYFSWKDYRQHKMQSLILTTVSFGIASIWSRGVKLSHFGHKVAGSTLYVGEQKVAEMAGKQLLQTVAKNTTEMVTVNVMKEVTKRIAFKSLEGLALGIANAGIDTILQNYLYTFCNSLSYVLLSKIEQKVQEHRITVSLQESYKVLGKDDAKNMINNLTKSMSNDKTFVERLSPTVKQISTGIIQGISSATEKMSKANSSNLGMVSSNINTITKIITWSGRMTDISKVTLATNDYLDKMERKILYELHKLQNLNNRTEKKNKSDETDEMKNVDEYKNFEYEVINQWKLILRENAQHVIKQNIVGPLMNSLVNKLVRYMGKMIKHASQNFKEKRYFEEFKKLQSDYQQKLTDISEESSNSVNEIKEHIRDDYEKNLIKLLGKTKNPLLFANIVEEGIPMESLCLKSCMRVIPNVLKKQGIIVKPFTINVEGENGIKYSTSSEENTKGNIINLKLIDNHFTLCNDNSSNISENNINNESENDKNNCLFETLRRNIPELNNITAKEFRSLIAHHIRNDPGIKYILTQGWHRLPLAFNIYGGDAREKKKITSAKLREKLEDGTFKFSQDSVALHTKDDHKHIGELSEEIQKKWDGKPVRVVKVGEESYIALDHRRVLASAIADPNTEMEIAIYDPDDEFSTENDNESQQLNNVKMRNHNRRQTAGDLLSKRIRRNSYDINTVGLLAKQVRVRVTESDYPNAKTAEKKLEDVGFIMGGIRQKNSNQKYNKYPRSKSSDRYDKSI